MLMGEVALLTLIWAVLGKGSEGKKGEGKKGEGKVSEGKGSEGKVSEVRGREVRVEKQGQSLNNNHLTLYHNYLTAF